MEVYNALAKQPVFSIKEVETMTSNRNIAYKSHHSAFEYYGLANQVLKSNLQIVLKEYIVFKLISCTNILQKYLPASDIYRASQRLITSLILSGNLWFRKDFSKYWLPYSQANSNIRRRPL